MRKLSSFLLLVFLLCGCAANKSNIDYLHKGSFCPVQFPFNGSYKQVWQATIRALAEEEIINTMNQDAGIVVTEFGTVEDIELEAIDTAFGARTYKYSFTINLMKATSAQTDVSVKTNLKMSQVALYEREQNIPWLESYLRKTLFIRICKKLHPLELHECDSFPSQYTPPPPAAQTKQGKKADVLVLQVQQTLTKRGYDPGPVDGFMGNKTRTAIKQFQKDSNIAVTGRPDQNTLTALGLKEGNVQYNEPTSVPAPTPIPEQTSTPPQPQIKTDSGKKHQQTVTNRPDEPPAPQKINTGKGKIIETTSLLSEPNFMANAIRSINAGQKIELIEKKDEFYKVHYRDKVGYIYADFIEITVGLTEPKAP